MKVAAFGSTALVCIAAAAGIAVFELRPPAAAGAEAPSQEFSAGRAIADVAAIAERPHPMTSADHDRVRDYIVSRLHALGVEPQLQRTTGVFARDGSAGRVTNILARLKGAASTRAVMLTAHYDSVPAGPGAGDDASGVASLLEALRALRSGPPLRNDVIIVFTDGEEAAMLGAAGFTEHAWVRDVGLVLNFDARGDSGPALMFETTPGNGRLIELLGASAPHPMGSSLTYAVYQRMPNDTDLTVYRLTGLTGLNFAFIGNLEAYHTPLDTAGHLSLATLQHQGSYALSLARAAGNRDLGKARLRGADAVYFNTIGSQLVAYPASWVVPLGIAAALLVLAVTVMTLRRYQVSMAGFAVALAVPPLSIAATVGASLLAVATARYLHRSLLPAGDVALSDWYAASVGAFAFAVLGGLIVIVRRRIAAAALASAALLWWAVLTLAASFLLPGASFLPLWPTVLSAVSVGIVVLSAPGTQPSTVRQIALLVILLPAVLLLAPAAHLLHVVFPLETVGTIVLVGYVALAFWVIAAPLFLTVGAWGRQLTLSTLALALVLFAAGAVFTRYSAAHPQVSNLVYLVDADAGRAYWASDDEMPNAWTSQVLTATPQRGPLPVFFSEDVKLRYHDAPPAPLAPPAIAVLGDSTAGGVRQLRLRVTPGADAWQLRVRVRGAEVASARVDGKPYVIPDKPRRASKEGWSLRFFAPPADGIELDLKLTAATPLTVRATTYTLGLPALAAVSAPPRPAELMPAHEGDLTVVAHAVELPAR